MVVLQGKGIFGGVAVGKLAFYKRRDKTVQKYCIADTENEYRRFETAREIAISQLDVLYQRTLEEIGKDNAMIFEIQKTMLCDEIYCKSVRELIFNQNVNAEYAVSETAKDFYDIFSQLTDEYLKERSSDVRDVSGRLLNILSNTDVQVLSGDEPVILAADDLVPSETIQLDRSKVLGFVTIRGTATSHTAILARTMNIPAVIHAGEKLKPEFDGHTVVVDAFTGTVYIDPDCETMQAMQKKHKAQTVQNESLALMKGKSNRTLDGVEIKIFANIGNISDIQSALDNDAAGIGLFRSEFLFIETAMYPTEEEQFDIYKRSAEMLGDKKLVVRTIDVGSDKQHRFFTHPAEDNPALGHRGIRICLACPGLFKTQLRALYRASVYGQISILFPMIVSLEEVLQIKDIIRQVQAELSKDGIPFRRDVELGIMVETPAAVMISDLLAKEVDFFSIGTNDLAQYTLAADRQNPYLESVYNPCHLSVLRMVQLTVNNAHANGIPVAVCGELAADPELTETLLSFGLDALSVAPVSILPLRKKIRQTNLSKVKSKILGEISGNSYTFSCPQVEISGAV